MKKLVVLLLVITMSLAVFACTKIEETRVEPIDPNGSGNAAAVQEDTKFVDKLSFVKDGEIYFDLHVTDSIKGFKVTVDGKEYPMGYSLYEDDYELEANTAVRRAAFRAFYDTLKKYENTTATAYNACVTQEKVLSELRGYKDVLTVCCFRRR